jgi:hypothetical protein
VLQHVAACCNALRFVATPCSVCVATRRAPLQRAGRKRVVLLDRCGVAVRASATAPASADGVADGSVAGRVAWQAFLARCLALEPEVWRTLAHTSAL